MKQEGVDVRLTIRDDGSKDNTILIIKKMMDRYPDKIFLHIGENVGYKRSFIRLLSLAKGASSFYAFSDQDDIWKKQKCIHAIRCMNEEYDLYVSSVENCNEDLEMISKNDLTKGKQSLKSDFIRHRFPGCTMIFTEKIRLQAINVSEKVEIVEHMPSHDFVISSVAYAIGKIYVDEASYILHRRTRDSLTTSLIFV